MKTISQAEKNDLLLALALSFEERLAREEKREPVTSARAIAEKSFAALSEEDLNFLKTRASLLDDLTRENRKLWSEQRLERARARGAARRLDENINPSYIVEILSREPKTIQTLVLRNLPPDLSRRIALYLELNFVPGERTNGDKINSEIAALIRNEFLSNFVALEDVYEPDALDKFSVDKMEKFIRQLGLREVAIACRGINSKETLAAFLNRFDEADVREIAVYITQLEKIRPFWVAQADEMVRQSWSADLPPAKVIKKIGFKLLASAFILRDETKCDYAAQKFSIRDVKYWQRLVNHGKKKYQSADAEEKERMDKQRSQIERLSVKFAETEKL